MKPVTPSGTCSVVGLDAKDGKVAVDGWSKITGHDVIDLAKRFEDYGLKPLSTPTLAGTACCLA